MKNQSKIIAVVLGVIMSLTLVVGSVNAASKCTAATINFVSVRPDLATGNASPYLVNLSCADAGWPATNQFFLLNTVGDSGYATLLTAISLNRQVETFTESRGWNALLTRIAIHNP